MVTFEMIEVMLIK